MYFYELAILKLDYTFDLRFICIASSHSDALNIFAAYIRTTFISVGWYEMQTTSAKLEVIAQKGYRADKGLFNGLPESHTSFVDMYWNANTWEYKGPSSVPAPLVRDDPMFSANPKSKTAINPMFSANIPSRVIYYNPETGAEILKNGPTYNRLLKTYSPDSLIRRVTK